MDNKFEIFGYYIDYFKNNRWLGSISISEPDRAECGYYGRKKHVAKDNIRLKKHTIKKGDTYTTELMKFCGRMKNKPKFD